MTQTAEILESLPPAQAQPGGLAQFDLAVTATPLAISWNRDAVSALLDATLEQYEGLVVQEEDVPAIKSEMAGLNKLRDRLDNARKEITRQIAGPLDAFDAEAKTLVARVVEVREGLNRQVKAFEQRDREGRRQSVQFVIDALKTSEGVPELDIPIKEPWLNKSIKQAQLHVEIQNLILKHKQDKAAAEQLERAKADRATMVEAALKAKAEEYGFSLPMGKFAPCLSLDITSEEAASVIGQVFAAEASLREQQAQEKAVPTPPPAAPFIEEDDFPTAPPVTTTLILSVSYEPARERAVQELLAQLRSVATVTVM